MKKIIGISLITAIFILNSCHNSGRPDPSRVNSEKELQEYLIYGWNTWNNNNLLEQILLPEGLMLKLSFRTNYRSGIPSTFYDTFISYSQNCSGPEITPIAHTYDGQYTELRIKWKGMTALIQTTSHHDDVFILFTPEELPSPPPIMLLEAGMLYNSEGNVIKNGHYLQANMGTRTHNIGSTKPDTSLFFPVSNPYLSYSASEKTAFFTGEKRSLEYITNFVERRKGEFYAANDKYGNLSDVYSAQRTVLGWNLIYDPVSKRAITPVSRSVNESWGGWVLPGWNSYFTAAMYATDNKYHAFANALEITNEITPDGFVPNHSANMGNEKSLDRSQPPVGSMMCKIIYDKYPEKWFLEAVYPKLLTWNRWWSVNRDNEGFLSWGSNPKQLKEISNTREAAIKESGMENSPLFDSALFNENTHKLELASVGLLSLYISDCKNLAEMAAILGRVNDQQELLDRAEKYALKLTELWDEGSGIYRDKNLATNRFSSRLSPTSFFPLITGIPTQEQAERMVNEHMLNPKEFYGEYMLPSIARNDSAFSDNTDWRGRISPAMNFLVYLGLRKYDLPEARLMLAEKSVELLYKEWKIDRGVYENYNATTGEGGDISGEGSFYTSGGLLSLIAIMENGYYF